MKGFTGDLEVRLWLAPPEKWAEQMKCLLRSVRISDGPKTVSWLSWLRLGVGITVVFADVNL